MFLTILENVNPIYLNTKGGDSIVLYPLSPDSYLKETYVGHDLQGQLRSAQQVKGPWTRDGLTFDDVRIYFQYLLLNAGYKQYDFQLNAS